jgi:hypothetical protein
MADLPVNLVTVEQVENRIGIEVLKRIFDDDNSGQASGAAVQQLCEDASSKVRGGIGFDYDLDAVTPEAAAATAVELRRITLDCAHAMIAIRHPGPLKLDGFALMEQVDRDLKNLRQAQTTLGTKKAPEPADHTASIASGPSRGSFYGNRCW